MNKKEKTKKRKWKRRKKNLRQTLIADILLWEDEDFKIDLAYLKSDK